MKRLYPRWVEWIATPAFVVITAALLLASIPIHVYLAWSRYLLRRESRRTWKGDPRVIVRDEGSGRWSAVLREQWPSSIGDRTIVLTSVPEWRSRRDLPLEWRVYLDFGPNYKVILPPVALVVRSDGSVQCVQFAEAIAALGHGDSALLDRQLRELARL